MVHVNNTSFYRLASTNQAIQGQQTRAISSRHAERLTTTSSATRDSTSPSRSLLTYTDMGLTAKRGHTELSSKGSTASSENLQAESPAGFESMNAVKALITRYQHAGEQDPTLSRSPDDKMFELSIKTREGDTITFSIGADVFYGQENGGISVDHEINFSFTIAGELSEEEGDAVDKLVARLADMAHLYRENGWADVEFLDAFDKSELAGLDLSVSGMEGKALSLTYTLDADAGTHTLAVNQNDYEYELNAENFLAQSGFVLQENDLYQQYRQVLIDTARSYKAGEFSGGVSNSKALEFFLDGLEAAFSPLEPEQDIGHGDGSVNAANANISDSAVEKAFLSGLPDFFASFNTPRFMPNASKPGEVSQMTLDMEQVTDISLNAGNNVTTLNQRYSFESRVSQHFGIGGDSVEHANLADENQPGGQTYLYEVINKSATLTRTLDVNSNGAVVAYREDNDSEHLVTTKKVVKGTVEDFSEEDLTDPEKNYSLALQAFPPTLLASHELHALRMNEYRDMQILIEAIGTSRIDLYS